MSFKKNSLLYNPAFQGLFLVACFVVAYWVPFSSLYNTWTTNDDYSYGILIPFISLYLFYEKRYLIKSIPVRMNWYVFPLLLIFVLLSIYGVLGSSGNISMPALPVLIILFSIFCFGWQFFKTFSLPICFLIFMVPLPAVLDRTVGVFLKSVSSEFGGLFLRLIGYSVYVSGNVIDLGVTKLQVIDACSGLRFLFPLMALGVIYSYFFEKVMWKRVICFLATIPIAVLTNVLRIGIAGILTYQFGSKMAEGFFHDFQGFSIFFVAFAFLFILGRFLRLFPPRTNSDKDIDHESSDRHMQGASNTLAIIISILIIVIVGALTLNTKALPPVLIKGGIESFPLNFSGWQGESQIVDREIIDASGAEEAFNAVYRNQAGNYVSLYMGYRSTAFLETLNFFHSPTVCLPSSGWHVIKKEKRIVSNVPIFGKLPVTEMVMETNGDRRLVYFWFQTKNKATHDKNINRFHLAMHAIKKDNTHDLFIRPITSVSKNETLDDAGDRMEAYIREMLPVLNDFLKDRQYSVK